jgi:rSAM/selenodomain-associated transferase 1
MSAPSFIPREIHRFMFKPPPPSYQPRRIEYPVATILPIAPELLIVFARVPLPGACKTRLAASIGPAAAAEVARALLARTLGLGGERHRQLRFDPPAEQPRAAALAPPGWNVEPQCAGDLGARMAGAFEDAFRCGYDRVVLIGSDAAGLEQPILERAFRSLQRTDVALGPATDGGYYLVGLRAPPPPGLFEAIAWSTPGVLDETLARCRTLGLSFELLDRLADVDLVGDLRALAEELSRSGRDPELLALCERALAGVPAVP